MLHENVIDLEVYKTRKSKMEVAKKFVIRRLWLKIILYLLKIIFYLAMDLILITISVILIMKINLIVQLL